MEYFVKKEFIFINHAKRSLEVLQIFQILFKHIYELSVPSAITIIKVLFSAIAKKKKKKKKKKL